MAQDAPDDGTALDTPDHRPEGDVAQRELPGDADGTGAQPADQNPAGGPGTDDSPDASDAGTDALPSPRDWAAPDSARSDTPDPPGNDNPVTNQPGPGANGSDQPPLSAYSDDPGTTVADYSVADHTDGQDAGVTDSEAAAAQPDSLPAPGDFQQWGEPDPPPSGTKNSTWEEGAAAPADDTSGQDAGVTDSEAAAAQPDSLPPPGDFQQVGAPDLPGSGTIHETWEEGPAAPGAPPPAAPPDPQPAPPPAPDLVAPEPRSRTRTL